MTSSFKPLAEIIEGLVADRSNYASRDSQAERADAEAALAVLYESQARQRPAVVWCRSIYQLVTLPSLLIGLIHSDTWQYMSNDLLERETAEGLDSEWDDCWSSLWVHGGHQLLQGMSYSSRLHDQYEMLEGELIAQCKSELLTWLKSRKLKRFEEKLNKQKIYRQFWAMNLWNKNFIRDRLQVLNVELAMELQRQAKLHEREASQFNPHSERMVREYIAILGSIMALVARMGAEPVAQLSHAVWLPFQIQFLFVKVAHMWMQHVDPESFSGYADEILAWEKLSNSVTAIICLEHVAFACEKPKSLSVDEAGRSHHPTEAAITFSDGFETYAWHGVIVDERIIKQPETITITEIEETRNIEMRRVLIERYGQSRYLADAGAVVSHEDEYGTLYRKRIEGDEALVMVKVINSTPEPDGTFREYFLRVPPNITTAKEAVAWTFGFEESDYDPLAES